MTTATSNTAYGIINDAMHDAGLLGIGDEPNSEQLADGMRRLCDIINLWQTQGLKLFLWQDVQVPLVVGQLTYSLGPTGNVVMVKPLRVLQGYVLQKPGNSRRPLVALSWDEFFRLSQVTGNNGMISSYFVDKQAYTLNVSFWNAPDFIESLNEAHLLLETQATNPINLEENVSFPQEWRIALRWGLADDISTGQPAAIMDRCSQKAKGYREALEDWDVEDTETRFTPDQRNFLNSGNFK